MTKSISPLTTPSVADLSWMAGQWLGERNGEPIEEHWSAPAADTMMGMFRWLRQDKVWFYELIAIEREADGVILRIKHFFPGLVGWEEKDESVVFVLVAVDGSEATFLKRSDGPRLWMVYRREGDDQLFSWFEREGETPNPDDRFRFKRHPVP